MGYHAYGSGSITIKAGVSEEALNAVLDRCKTLEITEPYTIAGQTFVDLDHDGSYHEDEVYDDLRCLTEVAKSGEIQFEGEDSTFWKIELKDGKWEETPGRVVYDLSDFSTEELQEELDRREREEQEQLDDPSF